MTRYIVFANIGLFLGYLNGVNIYYSASLLKLVACSLLLSVYLYFRVKSDRKVFVTAIFFCLLFIYGSIAGHVRYIENMYNTNSVVKNISGDFVLEDINVKDTSRVLIFKDMVVYTKSTEDFAVGDHVYVEGKSISEVNVLPKHLSDFQSFDLSQYWRTKGKSSIVFYPKLNKSSSTETEKDFRYYSYKIRDWFLKNIESSMPGKEAGIVMAMVWGDENYITQETVYRYRAAGISHILVLSGFNLAIIASFISILLRRVSLIKKSILTGIIIILFLIISQGGVSLYRAAAMTFISMYSTIFLKQSNGIYSLWFICLLFSLFSIDVALYDVSFHLSFLATLGIVSLFTPIKELFKTRYALDNMFFDLIIVTFSATIVTTPYIMYTFGYFKLSSIIFAVIADVAAPVATIIGILLSFIGSVSYLGKIIGYFAYIPIHMLNIIVETFSTEVNTKPVIVSGLTLVFEYVILYAAYTFLLFVNRTYVKTPKSK